MRVLFAIFTNVSMTGTCLCYGCSGSLLFGMYGIVWSQVTADILTVVLSLRVYRRYERRAFADVA